MAWIDDYLKGSQELQMPEKSYLYSSSAEMSAPTSNLGGAEMSSKLAQPSGGEAAGAAAMSSPASAGIMAGGAFLSNYMAQRAADERARRDRAMQIEQNYLDNQNRGFDTLMNTYRGALR